MPAETYLIAKLVHVVAVVLFLGNVTLGLFWVSHAQRMREPALLAHAMEGVIRSDRLFTVPGVLLIIVAGLAGAHAGGLKVLGTGWIAGSIALFALSGIVFGVGLAPLQRRIVALARDAAPDRAALDALLRRWHALGWLSVAPLWLAVAAMVLKRPL